MEPKEERRVLVKWWRAQGLSTRAANGLARRGIVAWEQLGSHSKEELLSWRGIGETTAEEIRRGAESRDIRLGSLRK
jgi:DNA-directed RNA polymerase alpha subunit